MKNIIKFTGISIFVLTCVCFWSHRSEASRSTRLETNFTFAESPRTLYLNNCARCHGADGTSQTEYGRLNDSPDISGGRARRLGNAKLTALISKGKGSMPGFGKKLTKTQISNIVSYVKGL